MARSSLRRVRGTSLRHVSLKQEAIKKILTSKLDCFVVFASSAGGPHPANSGAQAAGNLQQAIDKIHDLDNILP